MQLERLPTSQPGMRYVHGLKGFSLGDGIIDRVLAAPCRRDGRLHEQFDQSIKYNTARRHLNFTKRDSCPPS